MRWSLVYACDNSYFLGTLASIKSFLRFHSLEDWNIKILDVGMTSYQSQELSAYGAVLKAEPSLHVQYNGNVYPSARARINLLAELAPDDTLVYLDSDTIITGNLDHFVDSFCKSQMPIGITLEDVPEYFQAYACDLWTHRLIPTEFSRARYWHDLPMGNTGFLLARGRDAKNLGVIGLKLYDQFKNRITLAEQSIIVSQMYEMGIPFMRIPVHAHCFVLENFIVHQPNKCLYFDSEPSFQGRKIHMRHFCGSGQKELFNSVIRFFNDSLETIITRNC